MADNGIYSKDNQGCEAPTCLDQYRITNYESHNHMCGGLRPHAESQHNVPWNTEIASGSAGLLNHATGCHGTRMFCSAASSFVDAPSLLLLQGIVGPTKTKDVDCPA